MFLKIVSSAYVDLALLLSNTNVIPTEKSIYINEKGELMTRETSKPSVKIDSIEKWTDAFIIYSGIYSSAHIDSVQGLFKYLHDVRLGTVRVGGLGFKSYDEQFRLRRSMDPSIPWGKVDSELWLIYMSPSSSLQIASTVSQQSTNICFDYNYKGNCIRPVCDYPHSCIRCHGNHPVSQCPLALSYPQSQTRVINTRFNNQAIPKLVNHQAFAPIRFRPRTSQPRVPRGNTPRHNWPITTYHNVYSTRTMGYGKNPN